MQTSPSIPCPLRCHVIGFALQRHDPIFADMPFVVVHPARHPGTADFGDAVHGGRSGSNAVQRFMPGHAFKPIGVFFFDKGGCHIAGDELGVVHHRRQERQVVTDPFKLETIKGQAHFFDRAGAVGAQVQSLAIIGS